MKQVTTVRWWSNSWPPTPDHSNMMKQLTTVRWWSTSWPPTPDNSKMIAESGSWEDLLRMAEKSCWEWLLRMAAEKRAAENCWEELLRVAAEKSCWELLRRAAESGCWEWLWIKTSSFYAGWVWHSQPSRHFVVVGRPKLWWNANLSRRRRNPLVTSWLSDLQNCGETQILNAPRNDHFGSFFCENCRKHRAKRSFWKHCSMKFGGSLRNDHFGSFFCENCRKPHTKRSFWKLFLWKLSEASHETIILEASSVKFRGSLARNDHFGSFFCENCWKHRAKRSFWKLPLWKLREAISSNQPFPTVFDTVDGWNLAPPGMYKTL